jgi:LAO/AO transport system kinase
VDELWAAVLDARAALGQTALLAHRADQDVERMWQEVTEDLLDRLRNDASVRAALPELRDAVRAGTTAPSVAAQRLLDLLLARGD